MQADRQTDRDRRPLAGDELRLSERHRLAVMERQKRRKRNRATEETEVHQKQKDKYKID